MGKNIKIPVYRQPIFYVDFQYVNDRCFSRLLTQRLAKLSFDDRVKENYRCYSALFQ